jgi:hypothetical protein
MAGARDLRVKLAVVEKQENVRIMKTEEKLPVCFVDVQPSGSGMALNIVCQVCWLSGAEA